MAFDLRNDVFSKTFTGGDGNEYSIILVCGHHQDIVSGNVEEFPDNVILPNLVAEVGYEDDIPVGLPVGRSLSIEVDLANLNSGDWADVSLAIVRGRSETQRTVNGVAMYIPNLWVITPTSTGSPIYACQIPSTKEIDIDSGVAKYKIDLIGIEKPTLERLTITMLDLDNLTPTWTLPAVSSPTASSDLVNICYDVTLGGAFRYVNEDPVNGKKMFSMGDFFGRIEDKAQNLLDAFLRNFASKTVSINISDIDNIWTFYIQDVDTNHDKGTALTFSNLLIFGFLVGTGGDNKGGFFDAKDTGLYGYNNIWSFLRQFCDSMLMKATFGDTEPVEINFYPVLDTISTEGDLSDIDPTNYKLKPSDKYISEATAFTLGGSNSDVVNAKAVSEYGSIDGASNDSEIMFNSFTLEFGSGMREAINDGGDNYISAENVIAKKGFPSIRTLYYKSGSTVGGRNYFKIHDDCTLDVGGGLSAINGDSTYGSFAYVNNTGTGIASVIGGDSGVYDAVKNLSIKQFNVFWISAFFNALHNRQRYYGVGYNRSEGAKQIFSNENQGTFTAKISAQISNSDFIYLSSLGERYTVDLSSVSGIASLGEFSGSLILTNIKYDFIEGTADCTFFMRGDSGA